MGVALFLFKSLTLQREKSSLNLRLAQLGRKRIRLTHSASAKARQFSSARRELRNWLNSQLDGLKSGEASRMALEGGSTSPSCFGFGFGMQNSPQYQYIQNQYQTEMDNLEEAQKLAEEEKEAEELEIQEEQRLVQTQLEMINEELKASEEALKQAAKDGAPKYVA